MFTRMSLSRKIPGLVAAAALISVIAVGLTSYFQAASSLRQGAEEKFIALNEARYDALASYLGAIEEDLTVVAASGIAADALAAYTQGFGELRRSGDAEATLQKLYIEANPNPAGERQKLDAAADGSAYSASHARFHPWFRELLEARGYYDVFLISAEGDVVYSVHKELDFATNLLTGDWKDSDLGAVFRRARDGASADAVAFTDFAAYAPSGGAAASFIAAPVVRNGTLIGVLAFQMPVGRINQVMQSAAGMGETGETYLVGADHLMRSDSRFAEESTILKSEIESPTVTAALAGEQGVQEIIDYRGNPVLSVFRPIDFKGVRWAIIGEIDIAEMMAPVHAMRNVSALIGAGILVVVALVGFFAARGITGPIMAMTSAMGKLAEGDHGIEIPGTQRGDELGVMAKAVLVFKENMIKAAELAAKDAAAQQQREARARTIDTLTVDFDQEVGLVLKTVASAATEMQSTAASMTSTAEETSRQSTAVAAASEQASTNVQTVASAAEELSSSIAEISRQVAQSTEIAGKAVSDAERTNVQVQGLADAAQKIGEVVNLINEIASQTNLLALNATIEAARAGEAGKGFAVVAAEVKNLANETAKATEEITGQISGIQAATKEAVTAIQSIGGTISQINEIATTIASAVEEQGAATQEIARNVQQASAGTTEVSSNISGVTEAAASTGAAASQVLAAANELSQQSEMLRGKVETFLAAIKAA
ncbi:MAG: hypothetical protein BroJett029_34300 [Alphaproteobacteria bacterium]|nr:MAG: hypothetical protein BroJett029_34300 [Alphaproteobacteria bacterium]